MFKKKKCFLGCFLGFFWRLSLKSFQVTKSSLVLCLALPTWLGFWLKEKN